MRFIESKIDPSFSLTVLSQAEKDIIEALVEHPEVINNTQKWAEFSGRSTKAVQRFKKLNSKLLAPAIEYATKKYFLEIWASLIRRARKDEDVKGKELFLKALRLLKEEAPPEILQIFNITNNYSPKDYLSDGDIDKILEGQGPLELKP
jgi:hypothetical protein